MRFVKGAFTRSADFLFFSQSLQKIESAGETWRHRIGGRRYRMRIASASSRKCALISPPRSIAVCPPPAHIFLSQSSSPSSVGVLRECVTEGSSTDDASRARLESLAARFESTIYQTATTNEDYFH